MGASLKTIKLLQAAGLSGATLAEILNAISADCGDPNFVEKRQYTVLPMSRRRKAACASEGKRQAVFARDKFTCQYCGDDTPENMTVDHVVPRSKGGTNDMANLVAACRSCNQDKGDRFLSEWRPTESNYVPPIPERKPYTLKDLRRKRDMSAARKRDQTIVEGARRALERIGVQ